MGFYTLSIGTTALLTSRYGLDVTGQNLGNVDTPGYSRQRLNQVASVGTTSGLSNAIVGNGVWVGSVKRIGSEFYEKQLRQATTTDEFNGQLQKCYTSLQGMVNELSGNALSDSMSNFWKSMSNFSSNAESVAIRSTFLAEAQQMTTRFNKMAQQLNSLKSDTNEEIQGSVQQINQLLNSIAQLNQNIVNSEVGGASGRTANDLRDQRGEAVKELYEYMDVDVVEEANGSYIVSLHGRNLVYFDQVKEVGIERTPTENGMLAYQPVFSTDKFPLKPTDGKLAAQLKMRDEIIPSYEKEMDALAGNFMWEFNRIYSQGMGLEPFTSITAKNGPINPEATLNELQYADPNIPEGTFQIKNGNLEVIVYNKNTGEPTTVNIEIDLDGRPGPNGEPDMILWDPDNPEASHSLINRIQSALDKVVPGVFDVSLDRHYQLGIASNSEDYAFAFGSDTSGVLAALGMNTFFTGHNALSMGINQDVVDNPSLLVAARSFEKGDNDVAIDLMKLREEPLGNLKEMTLEDHYLAILGRLGSEANQTKNLKDLSCDVVNRMFVQRESLSGVNEDEEVTKLIVYQRAFQSAAKFISTVDQLYETLINM
ncbi:MAG: flagellar hook-associated protein FlgK [Planctomycetaceae bacterium]|nr:flagellar hook-associated protein FlgK [Planctomycetaceae bacterium]